MPFALRLFRLNLYNSYYRAQVCNDFALVPTEESQRWMQRYQMKLVSTPGAFELLWAVAGLAYPLQILKEKACEKKLTFHLELKNLDALCFSELSIDRDKVYYFHNQGTASKLHQETYVSQADKIAIQELTSCPCKLEKSFFGIVDIYLEELWKGKDLTVDKLPIEYTIHIKARETIWRYCVVDKNFRIKSPMKVVLDNEDNYFKYETDGELKRVNMCVYESKKPLALIDKPERFFSLKTYHKDKPDDWGETVVEKLPLPVNTSLRQDSKNQKVLYNDIFVYV